MSSGEVDRRQIGTAESFALSDDLFLDFERELEDLLGHADG